ncbi:NADPH-dependent F420 reductase [Streptosporangium sandarakinum]|uniref:NADPH-dependent F420 reductase n=1 Tax=Streptosporangium sandarakinum TaxID=1260955 RepID=UPI003F4C1E9D
MRRAASPPYAFRNSGPRRRVLNSGESLRNPEGNSFAWRGTREGGHFAYDRFSGGARIHGPSGAAPARSSRGPERTATPHSRRIPGATMRIGIIGAGNIGGALARRLTDLGHEVTVANSRGPQTLADLASETGAKAVTVEEAPRGADLVVVTIPECRVPELPPGLFDGVPDDVVVVDTGNYYPRQRDGRIEEIESGLPESRWVEKRLGRPVVKAFNNIYARHLAEHGRPAGAPGRVALPVAGDDEAAKRVVMDLIDQLGFDPVDAGGLDDSWRQQPGTPVYATDKDAEGVREALAGASRERGPEWRATDGSPGTFTAPA